ncbi:transcriptional regulator [Sphaerochaeta pleomorpha str. Grapes]|uniref:Transcriptional regulator n=1 Tax=Sphaerochaeta pleomorpha (strain ATCC BAA-1885 / DSM 22778 / Grapes) TaxID=158190 RepID=G8QV41_SPHPG|nr:FadR/GntR family transcriptional regulator [Sphaerochaeta pleomorpha]AEV29277.1 transcriptional regulator [Sphaerochaeta pleomorpha str. Grapes]
MEPIQAKKATSLRAQIYQQLRVKIENGSWEIGTKIPSEKMLCDEYGVSRITIRSAIQQLEALGFVHTHQGEGTKVVRTHAKGSVHSLNPLKPSSLQEDIIKVLEYRMVVERGTIGLAVQRITDEDIAVLEDIFNTMIVSHDDIDAFSKADYQFHGKIAEFSKNPILIQANQAIEEVLSTTMHSIVAILGCALGIRYHRLLIASLRQRDKKACEELMEEHVQTTIDGVKAFLDANGTIPA